MENAGTGPVSGIDFREGFQGLVVESKAREMLLQAR